MKFPKNERKLRTLRGNRARELRESAFAYKTEWLLSLFFQ